MYLRKVDGPRSVTLPDGQVITRADLPPVGIRRWVASRKAIVVSAIEAGLITRAAALADYGLSEDELQSWEAAIRTHGEGALRVTAIQKYRQP